MKRYNILRGIFGFVYIIGGIVNLTVTLIDVEMYRPWKDTAFVLFYKQFMTNSSTELLTAVMICVVVFQITIGLLILYKNFFVKIGIFFAMVFHLAIIPWGLWNLPSLIFLIPLYFLYKKNFPKAVLTLGQTKL